MTSPIITVENLSKRYHLGQIGATTLRESVERFMHRLRRKTSDERRVTSDAKNGAGTPVTRHSSPVTDPQDLWALRDVSFEVQPGEVLGIIGRNGAGKSTLLKILSRITEPTSGRAIIRGRVASLLEVGTGFHPELTGRENTFLNGAILGMKRVEIARKFDEIVAFAEVERFIDTPVKRYSSGMYVRLAFAVAAHLEPEILIVDEVLAVGDSQFQKKCLGKMQDVATQGRTVLFVSHNMTALKSLCQRAIWLEGGKKRADGPASAIVGGYLDANMRVLTEQVWNDPKTAPGNEQVRLHRVRIVPINSRGHGRIMVDTPVYLEFEFWNYLPDAELNISMVLYTTEEVCVCNDASMAGRFPHGLVSSRCVIPGNFFNDGVYRVRLLIVKDKSVALVDFSNVAVFEVHDIERQGGWYGKVIGVVRPKFDWSIAATHDMIGSTPRPEMNHQSHVSSGKS